MAELIGGDALGTALSELLKVVIVEQTSTTGRFKILLKRFQQTLERIEARLNETKNSSERLGRTQEGIERFVSYLEDTKELVNHHISIDALNELDNNAKECFLNLGSFPEDNRITDMSVVLYSEKEPSFGCVGRDRHNSQTSASDSSWNSPAPSNCDVDPRCGSLARENDRIVGAALMDMSVVLYSEPSFGCVARDRHNSQTSGSDSSCNSPAPSNCDVDPRCGSLASEDNGAQNASNLRDVILWNSSECLGRTKEEIEMLVSYLENAKKLVLKCPRVQVWNVYKKFVYANKLIRLEDELLRFFQIDVPLSTLNTSMSVETQVKNLCQKMDRAFSLGPLSDAATRAGGFSGSCGVPGLPHLIIGLDQHLAKLKLMLLMKDTRVLVVSAPGGYGKTTLAKMLCHDHEIKGIFGENIIYVIVSASSSLENIAQKLFDHFKVNHSPFLSEEDAKNQLESLLRQMCSGKMLLVLDDVWDRSESLVQDLMFQLPGLFKILVTSRFSFPGFSKYELSLLDDKDAKTLFCYSAFPDDGIPLNVADDLVNKMVKSCKGLPLALTVVGASLRGQPGLRWEATLKRWSSGQFIMQSHQRLLRRLQTSIDALDELPLKECFLDLGSFPEDDRIASTALLDMWVELYGLDNEGIDAGEKLLDLSLRNLVNLVPISKDAGEIEGYCHEHYVKQHELLRELAIHLNDQNPIAERKRLFMEIYRNDFPTWWIEQIEQPINARIISVSTDEAFRSSWCDLNAPKVEVLILNTRSKIYALPQFIKRMSQLKVLIVAGYGVYPSQIDNLHFLGSLTNLRRIRFEHVSVSPSIQVIFAMQNLRKLTFVTCEIGNALKSGTTEYPYMLPNLTDLEIDRCYDLKELPAELCSFVNLEKLSITNCHELEDLPKALGSLSNLQTLRLHCCTKLQQLPESIGSLHDLSLFDISDCQSISALPEQIGELTGLRVLKMSGCQGLQELPVSMSQLSQLEDVICNEETSYLWERIWSENFKLKINIVEEDRLENFKKICQ